MENGVVGIALTAADTSLGKFSVRGGNGEGFETRSNNHWPPSVRVMLESGRGVTETDPDGRIIMDKYEYGSTPRAETTVVFAVLMIQTLSVPLLSMRGFGENSK
jgi:hypothetical protein